MSATDPAPPPETPDLHGAFPRLGAEQLGSLAARGRKRPTRAGEVLFREGDEGYDFFVVLQGMVAVVEDHGGAERVVTVHGPGRFLGELSLLTGQAALLTYAAARSSGWHRPSARAPWPSAWCTSTSNRSEAHDEEEPRHKGRSASLTLNLKRALVDEAVEVSASPNLPTAWPTSTKTQGKGRRSAKAGATRVQPVRPCAPLLWEPGARLRRGSAWSAVV